MMEKCKYCGHEWLPRKQKPLACPRCKRYGYVENEENVEKVKRK